MVCLESRSNLFLHIKTESKSKILGSIKYNRILMNGVSAESGYFSIPINDEEFTIGLFISYSFVYLVFKTF